jgi:tripartite-type tricarboxylate transporter receptor subunit TctC
MGALAADMFAATAFPFGALAAWPERPITLLHGFGAGGNGDVTARVVADRLQARLGQSVVVEPKPGAGGRVAAGSSPVPPRTATRSSCCRAGMRPPPPCRSR